MKGHKVRWQLLPILLASAALGFGQMNAVPAPRSPAASSLPASRSAMEPVGPGTINYVEGQVSLNGQELTPHSVGTATLKPGQVLDTADGYAEVLLTPGAFLRVGHNSEIRILSAGLADTQTEVAHGASILEVDQLIKGTHLAVAMNGTTTQIEKKGLYDFDATQQAVMVLDGKAKVQEQAGTQNLGKHDEVLLASNRPLKRRGFDENTVKADPLYVWSKARSEDEAQASASAASNANIYATAGPGWFWDPYWDFYGFWPAASALYSPFGWGFYSPAFFGFGYYGGGYYGGFGAGYYGRGRYVHPGQYAHRSGNAWHGRVGGMNATPRAFHSGGFSHPAGGGGFHGGMAGGGFHGGGGSHGGNGRR